MEKNRDWLLMKSFESTFHPKNHCVTVKEEKRSKEDMDDYIDEAIDEVLSYFRNEKTSFFHKAAIKGEGNEDENHQLKESNISSLGRLQERNEPGPRISNDLADRVQVQCKLCSITMTRSRLRSHTRAAHDMTIKDYSELTGPIILIEEVFHRCQLCGDLVLLDRDSMASHLRAVGHRRISHSEYNRVFMVDSMLQKRLVKTEKEDSYTRKYINVIESEESDDVGKIENDDSTCSDESATCSNSSNKRQREMEDLEMDQNFNTNSDVANNQVDDLRNTSLSEICLFLCPFLACKFAINLPDYECGAGFQHCVKKHGMEQDQVLAWRKVSLERHMELMHEDL